MNISSKFKIFALKTWNFQVKVLRCFYSKFIQSLNLIFKVYLKYEILKFDLNFESILLKFETNFNQTLNATKLFKILLKQKYDLKES